MTTGETNALRALEALIRANGCLKDGEPLPTLSYEEMDAGKIGFCVENNTVLGLSARYCGLTSLLDSSGQFTHLRQLDLTGNQLTSIPESIGNLTNLKRLYLDENRLTALPESIGNLAELEEIHLDQNELTVLPPAIGSLKKLKQLRVMRNKLVALPHALWQLPDLKVLNIGENPLESLPESVGCIDKTHGALRTQQQFNYAAGKHGEFDEPSYAGFGA